MTIKSLINADWRAKSEAYLIEVPGRTTVAGHFFTHKGEEFGYVLSGRLQLKIGSASHRVTTGDTVYLTVDTPLQWKNWNHETAQLIWLLIK